MSDGSQQHKNLVMMVVSLRWKKYMDIHQYNEKVLDNVIDGN